jgi:hypothetical protein
MAPPKTVGGEYVEPVVTVVTPIGKLLPFQHLFNVVFPPETWSKNAMKSDASGENTADEFGFPGGTA